MGKLVFDEYLDNSPSADPRPTAYGSEVSHLVHLINIDEAMTGLLDSVLDDARQRLFKEKYVNWLFFYDITHYFESEGDETVIKLYESMPLLFFLWADIRQQRHAVALSSR